MLHSYPPHVALPPPEQQMCKISFSPLRSPRRRIDHERNHSESIPRTRPISTVSQPTMQHAKRASIYVSDASIILAQRTPMVSTTAPQDALLSPSSETSETTDHYAILELEPKASTQEIREAYRRLRMAYFQSDAKKYRALQAAFDVLMDPEARQAYDTSYQASAAAPALSSIGEVVEQSKHERKDSAHGDEAVIPEEEEEQTEETRSEDPNWGLKRHRLLLEPLIGSEPYQSFVPMPVYFLPKGSAPTYVGQIAQNAVPN